MDVPRELAAHRHLGPFDPIDPGIAARATALDADLESGNKSQVHEMLGDRMVQLQLAHDGALADAEIGQCARSWECVAACARI